MANVNKQKVKNYLEYEGKELGNSMKENLENKDSWSDFKNEFAVAVASYAKNPNKKNMQKLEDIISMNFSSNMSFGKDALDTILKDLGIKDLKEADKEDDAKNEKEENCVAYRREIFEKIGVEFPDDVVAKYEKEWQEKQNAKYGITTPSKKKQTPKQEEKKIVNPKLLAKNKEMLEQVSGKLTKMSKELNRAKDILANKNKANFAEIPDDIKIVYSQIENLDEDGLENFEEELNSKAEEQVITMRAFLKKMQNFELEEDLKEIASGRGYSEEDIKDEVEYIMLDSKLDKDGNLVLPAHSIFKDIFKEEDSDIANIKEMLTTYTGVPKVSDLSDEELKNLAKHCDELEKMNPKSKEYAIVKSFEEHPELLFDGSNSIIACVKEISTQNMAVTSVIQETETRHKIFITEEIQEQFLNINNVVNEYNTKEQNENGLGKKDYKKRETILKIAKAKVRSLEKAGLSKVVAEGEKTSKGVLKRAREVLMPSLSNARDKDTQKLEKQFEKPEESQEEQEP